MSPLLPPSPGLMPAVRMTPEPTAHFPSLRVGIDVTFLTGPERTGILNSLYENPLRLLSQSLGSTGKLSPESHTGISKIL
jgi:hypothetical protein